LDAVATGQIFTAKQAIAHGLVDRIGFLDDAVARAAELAGQNADTVRCVKYEKQPTLIGTLLGAESNMPERAMDRQAALIDLATPRAYYLWSWLPAALGNSRSE
jgi:protease-4